MSYPNKFIYCIEYIYAKPEYREQLITALLNLTETVRMESGCLQYDLLLDKENHNLIIVLVKFKDQESMLTHEQQTYVQSFAENEMQQYCEKIIWNEATSINS